MARLYLIVIIVAAIAGAIVGKLDQRVAPAASDATEDKVTIIDKPVEGPQDEAEFNASQDAIVLKREPNGHFYADAEVNNMTIRFMIDTGATGIALTRDDARRAGLAVSAGMFEVVAEGASGDVKGEWVTLDTVKLGQQEAKQVPAVILDGGQQSLLGQSFLSRFSSVEIKGDRMLLR